MRRIWWVAGGVLVCLVLALVILRIVGLDPHNKYPGLWLRGEVVTTPVTDWSFASEGYTNDDGGTFVQTRQWFLPMLPHSVNIARHVYKGELYLRSFYPAGIPLGGARHWNRNILADPRVRIKIGNKLYDRKLEYITDPVLRDELMRAVGPNGGYFNPGVYLQVWHVVPDDTK